MARCVTPFMVENKDTKERIPVPCGRCPDCMARRTSGWSFRLLQEGKVSSSAHFVTLTYDTSHVPITEKGFMNLCKRDVQLFMKRLRKISPNKLRYFACGEYGTENWRPHYHLILFNAEMTSVISAWQLGHVHFGPVNGATIGYTLKYMMKETRVPVHRNDDRQPEFQLMSKGLGANYLTPEMEEWHLADMYNRMYIPIEDGKKIAMPRYYKMKLYTDADRENIGVYQQRVGEERDKEKEKEMLKLHGEGWRYIQVQIDQARFQKMYKKAIENRKLF